MSHKVFDCFTFFNEVELLELRLSELYDVVDHFVLSESMLTFTGQPKPLYFLENKQKFSKFIDKIIHIVVSDPPRGDGQWVREEFQREAIRRGLVSANENDLILISDVDEIISADSVRKSKKLDGYIQYNMAMYQFYMNLLDGKNAWSAAFGFTWRHRSKVPDFSNARWDREKILNAFGDNFHTIDYAGWHFTHLGGIGRLQHKFQSYSHSNDPWPKAMMKEGALAKHILAGGKVGNAKELSEFVPIDESYPRQIRENKKYYSEIGFIKDPYVALKELQTEYQALRLSYATQTCGDGNEHPALGGLTGQEFLSLAGVENPFLDKIIALPAPKGVLLSSKKKASQSSISEWSRGVTIEEDAAGAVDGIRDGTGKFHTSFEDAPWWMIDLGAAFDILEIRIYNRLLPLFADNSIAARCNYFKIETGDSEGKLRELFRRENDQPFGGVDGKPLIIVLGKSVLARFIKIQLLRPNYLHLDQIEVYGLPDPK